MILSIDSKNCIDECPLGDYKSIVGQFKDSSAKCSNCKTNCHRCNAASTCEECFLNYYFDSDKQNCVNICEDGNYLSQSYSISSTLKTTRICDQCPNNCKIC